MTYLQFPDVIRRPAMVLLIRTLSSRAEDYALFVSVARHSNAINLGRGDKPLDPPSRSLYAL